jgi:hypothetical protein
MVAARMGERYEAMLLSFGSIADGAKPSTLEECGGFYPSCCAEVSGLKMASRQAGQVGRAWQGGP